MQLEHCCAGRTKSFSFAKSPRKWFDKWLLRSTSINLAIHYYFGINFLNQEKFVQYCYRIPIKKDSLINSDWGKVWEKLTGDEILNYGTTISYWFTANISQYICAYRYAFLKESQVPAGPVIAEFAKGPNVPLPLLLPASIFAKLSVFRL